LKLSKVKLK